MESQRAWGGPNAEYKAKISPIWDDFEQLRQDAFDWYGMDENFYNISFNVLGVERNEPAEIGRKNQNLKCWDHWASLAIGGHYDIELSTTSKTEDHRQKTRQYVHLASGIQDLVPVLDHDLPLLNKANREQADHPRHLRNRSHNRRRGLRPRPRRAI